MALCYYHLKGVPVNAGRFYQPGCPKCEVKLKEKKVTVDDPLPGQLKLGFRELKRQQTASVAKARHER